MDVAVRRWSEMDDGEREGILSRSAVDIAEVTPAVRAVIDDVRLRGDAALRELSRRFDGAPEDMCISVPRERFDEAEASLSPKVLRALEYSVENVRRFHSDQDPDGLIWKEIRAGIRAGERTLPIESAGLYVPRSRGSFPSMLYMMAVPARIAGVGRIAVCTPPDGEGRVDAACLYAARLCGVDEVYALGGAQAWAALAYGTESVRPVVKCLGPGSRYVAAAKRILADVVDCGLPAGPSESVILADSTPDPRDIARNLLVEAEHGSDSSALLITDCPALAEAAASHVRALIAELPRPRRGFVTDVIGGCGGIILVDSIEEGAELANRFAAEHLQIRTEDPFAVMELITNAGEILLGDNTPFSAANYSTGANAVLPTFGAARTFSPLSVRDFKKRSGVVYLTREGFEGLRGHAAALAEYEDFPAHRRALADHGS